jgi:CDP-glucose 4,6-dehydratase
LIKSFGYGELTDVSVPNALHEANLLMLDITKAKTHLGWRPRLDAFQTIDLVADWYKKYQSENVYEICLSEIGRFLDLHK